MQPPETVALRATGHRQGPSGAHAQRTLPRHRRGRRLGLTALPPPGGPRIVPQGSGQLPGRIPEGSRQDPAWVRRQRDAAVRAGGKAPLRRGRPAHAAAPSPGAPAWADGPSAARRPSNRPARIRPASRKDPGRIPPGSGVGEAPAGRGGPGGRQGPPPARSPSARRRAIAGVAGLGRRPFRRPEALESSSNRSRTVLESSRQDQRRGLHHRGGMLRSAWAAPAAPGRQCWSSRAGSVGGSPGRAAGGQRRPGGGAHPIERSQTTKPCLSASSPMARGRPVLRAPGRRMKRGSISARIKPPAASSKLGFFRTEGLRRQAISPSALSFRQSASPPLRRAARSGAGPPQ